MAQKYDRSSKWLLEHQGRGLAILGGLRDVVSCQAVQAEVVQPIQLPDGLLEVRQRGRKEPRLVLIEFCTYPESRTPGQLMDDVMLVVQARKVVPEVLALVLCPKGQARVPSGHEVRSELGWTRAAFEWKVQELWTLPAEQMLAVPDVGIVPWVPLMAHEGPPEPLLRRCRERIDREGGEQRPNLLAVTQVLMQLKFVRPALLEIFGGSRTMIESPLIQEIEGRKGCEVYRTAIEDVMLLRFTRLSADARARLHGISDQNTLHALHRHAVVCPSMEDFVARLAQETTPPPPPSSRRKKKS